MTDRKDVPVLVVFGPTASGKTALAGSLFALDSRNTGGGGQMDRFKGLAEIISADSMQVYRGMDIGTAKPDAAFLAKLPHHLINLCDPREQFCAGDFVRLADIACAEINSRGKLPVLLGGTAFYIRNFLYGLPETPESDPAIRSQLRDRAVREGLPALWAELQGVDPVSAAHIHIHDEYRIVRALEVYAVTGRPRSSFSLPAAYRAGYRFLVISLERPRDELYRRIDARVDEMFSAGLPDEFRRLLDSGCTASDPGMQAIGYREFFMTDPLFSDLPAVCAQIQHDTRKYAKRQDTFIRAIPDVVHLPADDFPAIYSTISAFYTAGLDGFPDSVHT